jgi:signal transduction histidine kinase
MAALARGVAAAIEESHPEVKFTVVAGAPATVNGVEPRLDSVVRNLVDNAASFAGEGGDVRVSVKVDPADAHQVILEVCDTGPGIPEKDLPRMFERFFTTRAVLNGGGSEPSARKQKGTGLGLALVKAVAEAHGGHVSAHSSPGSGTTFRVVLPVG